ncbi:GNAT family N-acetyltransferase [Paenibacillus sp. SYP-B3998]|uniref:GNAT family N-acetyltransferase n=1 Tax=Paenibacillus sp. SYP-B3998 TaxID=2678564 RepID=A0A6G3ZS30_9BACL|nr:GNAT family N-acetyltransferase [Paenibacillus sp. SYP-B3998]NEW04925.1 GNAT family N-acetyltransferase [Paenibacillus sp. SYP-B3998]
METIEIRQALNRSELDQVFDICAEVFPEDRPFFQERIDYDCTYALETTHLAFVDGIFAATVQVFPYMMRWGSIALKVGGIGSVATLPKYRNRGLAQQLMRRQSDYMKVNGYDLSMLLTGRNSFYEQVGWCTIPEEPWVADASLLRADSLESYRIRFFEEADLDQVSQIYAASNLQAVASMVRSIAYWKGQLAWKAVKSERFLVAEGTRGQLVAYLRYKIVKDNQLIIADCGYLSEAKQAAIDLLGQALAAEACTTVRAMLPSYHILNDYLSDNGARREIDREKMWKAFSLTGSFIKMVPELKRRIQKSHVKLFEQPTFLLFTIGCCEEAQLYVHEDKVEVMQVHDSLTYNFRFQFNDKEWITLLLKGFQALNREELQGSEVLNVLFPETPYVFWEVDYF